LRNGIEQVFSGVKFDAKLLDVEPGRFYRELKDLGSSQSLFLVLKKQPTSWIVSYADHVWVESGHHFDRCQKSRNLSGTRYLGQVFAKSIKLGN